MTRYILVNHFNQNYFDLGIDFPLPPPRYWHGNTSIIEALVAQNMPYKTPEQRQYVFNRLSQFLYNTIPQYLETLWEHTPEYDYIISDFQYTMYDSRYELKPTTLSRRSTPITYDFPLPLQSELDMCTPAGVKAYCRRTNMVPTVGFYVLKKGL